LSELAYEVKKAGNAVEVQPFLLPVTTPPQLVMKKAVAGQFSL